jgi:hypothetical protein
MPSEYYRLHFTCYHFTSKNFLKILRFESRCFQLYRAQLYVIGSGRNKCFVCIKISTYFRTYGKFIACKGSGILTLLFFQGLCETSSHSAWTSSTCKKKGAAFWVYCLYMSNGWKCCRYLGISNKVVMLFQCCFYKGSLLWLYALA